MRKTSATLSLVAVTLAIAPTPARGDHEVEFGRTSRITAFSLQTDTHDAFGHVVYLDDELALIGRLEPFDADSLYVMRRDGVVWRTDQILLPSDPVAADRFSREAARSGDTLVVGAHSENLGPGYDEGAVYVFDRASDGAWAQSARLTASDAETDAVFGWSVDIQGDRIAVGAAGVSKAHIFERVDGVWTEMAIVTATPMVSSADFGHKVRLGDQLFVSGPDRFPGGEVYVFEGAGDTWTQVQTITAPAPLLGADFGRSVLVEGTTLVIGAPMSGGVAMPNTFVYTFDGSSWQWEASLAPTTAGTTFGSSLALDGDELLAGSSSVDGTAYRFQRSGGAWTESFIMNDGYGPMGGAMAASSGAALIRGNMGTVHAFDLRETGWMQTSRFPAVIDDAAANEGVGAAVATDGATVLYAAPGHDAASGDVYAYTRSVHGWRQQSRFGSTLFPGAFRPGPGDEFGAAVGVVGNMALVGAPGAEDGGGRLYTFVLTDDDWDVDDLPVFNGLGRLGEAIAMGSEHALASERGYMNGRVRVLYFGGKEWYPIANLTPEDTTIDIGFGEAVAVDDVRFVVGAPNDGSGSAYVFDPGKVGWDQTGRLTATGGADGDALGAAVSVVGDRVAVGAPGADTPLTDAGAVVIFEHTTDGWMEKETITPPDAEAGDAFGSALSMHGGFLAVGAPGNGVSGAGAVYLYRHESSGWVLQPGFPKSGAPADALGDALHVSATALVASAPGDDTAATDGGGALLIDIHVAGLPLGDSCGGGDECESGFCVDDVC